MTPMMQTVVKGAVSESVLIRLQHQSSMTPQTSVSEGTAGLVIRYWRDTNAFEVSIAPVSLTDLSATYNPGGIKHIADGWYRLDVPNAAFAKAAGVNNVLITASVTAMISGGCFVTLVDGSVGGPYGGSTPQVY